MMSIDRSNVARTAADISLAGPSGYLLLLSNGPPPEPNSEATAADAERH